MVNVSHDAVFSKYFLSSYSELHQVKRIRVNKTRAHSRLIKVKSAFKQTSEVQPTILLWFLVEATGVGKLIKQARMSKRVSQTSLAAVSTFL